MGNNADDSYDDLIEESIDELNASGKLEGAGVDEKEDGEQRKNLRSDHPLFLVLFSAAFLSLSSYIYFIYTDYDDVLTPLEADRAISSSIKKSAVSTEQKKVARVVESFANDVSKNVKGTAKKSVVVDRALEKFAKDLARAGVDVDVVNILNQRDVSSSGEVEFISPAVASE